MLPLVSELGFGYILIHYRCFYYKSSFEEIHFELCTLLGFLPTVTNKYININIVECLSTLIPIFMFAKKLVNSRIEIRTDSNTVFTGLQKQTIKAYRMVPYIQLLLQKLFDHNISYTVILFKSKDNELADKLLRNTTIEFEKYIK